MNLFAEQKNAQPKPDEADAAAPYHAAQQIVGRVKRGAPLQQAEAAMQELRRKFETTQAKIRELIRSKDGTEKDRTRDRELLKLSEEQTSIGAQHTQALRTVGEARKQFDDRIRVAIRPLQTEALTSALTAIGELKSALALFDQTVTAARRVGTEVATRPRDSLDMIEQFAQRQQSP